MLSNYGLISGLSKSELQEIYVSLKSNNNKVYGYTKLMDAIVKKQPLEVVMYCVKVGENVNDIDSVFIRHTKPVLRYALDRGIDAESVAIIKFLIESGVDVNEQTYNRVHNKLTYGFMSLLSYAVIYSSSEIVQFLVNAGAQINKVFFDSSIDCPHSPLFLAHKLEKKEIIDILKQAGAKAFFCA